MIRIYISAILLFFSIFVFAQPSNDACTGAQNLGSLPTPGACAGGVQDGATITVNGQSTVGATADDPYIYLTNCTGSATVMAAPALDTWYSFVATGTVLHVAISGFANANIAVWSGTCSNLSGRGCAVANSGGNGSLTVTQLFIGQTYYIQVSGNNSTDTDNNFSLTVDNDIDCNDCLTQASLTVSPQPVNGSYTPGQVVTFCYSVTGWVQQNTNWIHGIQITYGSGWSGISGTVAPSAICNTGSWKYFPTGVGVVNGINWGPGFYFDTNDAGSSPTDNFGDGADCDPSPSNPLTFCWNLTVNSGCAPGSNLSVTVNTSGDGESGGWTSNGCNDDDATIFNAVGACCPPTMSHTNILCNGSSTGTATATPVGSVTPYTYDWSNGQTTQTISGLAAGTYNVTVTDANLCASYGSVTVTQPAAYSASITSKNNVLCYGGTSGNATVTVSGGTPNYTYAWSGGTPATTTTSSTTNTVNNLAAGTYTVTVTDANSCVRTVNFTITEPAQLSVSLTPTNETCNNANNGSIVANVSNGTANYNYTCTGQPGANNKPNTWTFSGLADGPYTVGVTDANGCTTSATTTINPGPTVTASFTFGGGQCYNSSGNSFTFTNTSTGATGYSWTFSGGTPATSTQTSPTVTFSTSGVHPVTLTASNGATCTASTTINANIYPNPTVTLTGNNVTCNGASDGSVIASASGGSGVYNYVWSNSAPNNSSIININAGPYTLTVSDGYGCSVTAAITITEPPSLSLTATRTNVSCNGLCDGTASVSASGGSGSYSYSWSSGQTTANISALCDGSYTVTVYDVNSTASCNTSASVVVSEPAALTLTTSSTNSTCGGSNGTATVTINDTIPNYTYNWTWTGGNNNSTTASTTSSVNTLPSGPAFVTVTNGGGCSISTVINVGADAGPTSSITSSSNVGCNGGNTGSATVTVSGGTPSFSYAWDGGAPVVSASNTNFINTLTAGTHTVQITDNLGCITSASVSISEPAALVASTTVINAHCGLSDGSATVTVNGGTTPYSYAWSGGGSTSTISSKPAGNYTVTITDANSCYITASATINDLPGITSLSTTQVNALCYGASNGSATVNVTGGTPSYTYAWSTSPSQISQTASGLAAGSYGVTVTDFVGCKLSTTVTITQPTQLTATISNFTDVSCSGGNNGTATVNGNGGTTPYSYQWSPNAGSQNTQTANNLGAGTFTVTVIDLNNCYSTASVTINQPTPLTSNITSTTSAHCGHADGGATVQANGGTSPYSYAWSAGSPLNQPTVSGLTAAGSPYFVTVTDTKGCTSTASVTITDIPAGTATIIGNNVSCNGYCDGNATVSTSNATPPFTYSWNTSPAQTTVTANNLCAGNYSVIVTDYYNCTATASVTISQPAQLTVSINSNDASCHDYCNGSATATPTGGTTPYTYQWDNSTLSQTQSISGLCQGTRHVTVTDFEGCTVIGTVDINQPNPMSMAAVITDANCNQYDGAIDITVSNGPSPFTYSWSNAETTEDVDSIQAGSYCVVATNVKGCTIDSCFIVKNLAGPEATITSFANSTCFNANNGTASVFATGGTGFYTYLWNDPAGTMVATAVNLDAGEYVVTVTDTTGCYSIASVTITEPAQLGYNIYTHNPTCNGYTNGWASLVPFGGTAPYGYQWIGTGTNPNDSLYTGLGAGSYDFIITDSHGCDTLQSVTLTQPTGINLTTNVTSASCSNITDGSVNVACSGGQTPYTYQWGSNTGLQTTQTASGLGAGTYCVTVTDANGCTQNICASVTAPNPLVITIDGESDLDCFEICNGNIQTSATGGTQPYSVLWSNGKTSDDINNLCAGTYYVTYTDFKGCTATTSVIVSQPPELQISTTITNETCFNYCNGKIDAVVWGGTPISSIDPYDYQWNDNNLQTTATASGLCPGSYSLTVTDGNNCNLFANAVVSGPDELVLLINPDSIIDATCGNPDGCAMIDAEGGTFGFHCTWSDNLSPDMFHRCGLAAGSYGVTLTDTLGCAADTIININNIAGPVIDSITKVDVLCYGMTTGSATVYYSGGTDPITIQWGANANNQTTALAYNLGAGNFSVILTDANDCSAAGTVNISGPSAALNATITNQTNSTCNGVCNASASMLAVGGTPGYTYLWNDPAAQTTPTAVNLCAGTYSVQITDSHACSIMKIVNISQPQPLAISLISLQDISCYGRTDGQIAVTGSGGSGTGYSYLWLPSNSTGFSIGQLGADDYTVILSDLNDPSCTASQTYSIVEPEQILVSTDYIPAKCNVNNFNGVAYISQINGGVYPYSFAWTPCNSSCSNDTIYNVNAGTYQVQVYDHNGCDATSLVNVGYLAPPDLYSLDRADVRCAENIDGSATIVVSEGQKPYAYDWYPHNGVYYSVNDSTLQIDGLSAGYYTATISDYNGCAVSSTFEIESPAQLTAIVNPPSALLCQHTQYAISASVQGGTPPYIFTWSNGLPSQQQNIINTGDSSVTYHVTITDANGCQVGPKDISIYVYPDVSVSLTTTDSVICKGEETILYANIETNGVKPYYFIWNDMGINPDTIRDVSPNADFTYMVTVTDVCGSMSTDQVFINVLPLPNIFINGDTLSGCEPLKVDFYNEDHQVGYTYQWNFGDLLNPDNFSSDTMPSHIYPNDGLYTVSVTVATADGCRRTQTNTDMVEVYPNPDADVYPVYEDENHIHTVNLFEADIQFVDQSSADPDYITNWYWDFGDNTYSIIENPSHRYEYADTFLVKLTVMSNHGCVDSTFTKIHVREEHTFYAPTAFSPGSPTNPYWYPFGRGVDLDNYHLYIYDRWGELIFDTDVFYDKDLNPDPAGIWDGKVKGSKRIAEIGVYAWYVNLFDVNGTPHEYSGTITIIR